MKRFLDILIRAFWSFFVPRTVRIPLPRPRTHACRVCGRTYTTPDHAAWCGDWDRVLGVRRHELKL